MIPKVEPSMAGISEVFRHEHGGVGFPTKTWELCGTFGDFLLEMNVNQKKSTKKCC